MTRVVVDSNVYISALVFGGVPQRLLDRIHAQGVELYVSPAIMNEVAEVLEHKFGWSRADLKRFLSPLWNRCLVVTPGTVLDVCADPDDDRVLECAVSSGADY